VLKRGLVDYLEEEKPDVLCLQETRCEATDVTPFWPRTHRMFFNTAKKRGYAGTAILSRRAPLAVSMGIGIQEHDEEGRVLTAEYDGFYVVNVYVPNAKRDLSRLDYRQRWDTDFLRYLKRLERKKPVVFCGDLNVAHTKLDLTHPKANVKNHGFTPQERAGFDALVKAGFIDTFREFDKGPGKYTWWRAFGNARERNVGWRIDYFLVSSSLRPQLKSAFIRPAVEGSDHCPVGIVLK
jgi:exodeoxyribonuclease-3